MIVLPSNQCPKPHVEIITLIIIPPWYVFVRETNKTRKTKDLDIVKIEMVIKGYLQCASLCNKVWWTMSYTPWPPQSPQGPCDEKRHRREKSKQIVLVRCCINQRRSHFTHATPHKIACSPQDKNRRYYSRKMIDSAINAPWEESQERKGRGQCGSMGKLMPGQWITQCNVSMIQLLILALSLKPFYPVDRADILHSYGERRKRRRGKEMQRGFSCWVRLMAVFSFAASSFLCLDVVVRL